MDRQIKLIILGSRGSFHDMAAQNYFGKNRVETLSASTFQELAKAVESDDSIDYGVMAVENSIAGSILQNYRILREYKFWISGELYLRINHHLVALPGQSIEDIHTVRSHPMALQQCLHFFKNHPRITLEEGNDTASCAIDIAQNKQSGVAAIGSPIIADMYGLETIAQDVETSKVNFTRFVIFSKQPQYTSVGNATKASIYLRVSEQPGSLLKVLQSIADNGINITKIQSFPVLGMVNQYYFYLDIDFETLSQYETCIEQVKRVSFAFDELGIYKKGTYSI